MPGRERTTRSQPIERCLAQRPELEQRNGPRLWARFPLLPRGGPAYHRRNRRLTRPNDRQRISTAGYLTNVRIQLGGAVDCFGLHENCNGSLPETLGIKMTQDLYVATVPNKRVQSTFVSSLTQRQENPPPRIQASGLVLQTSFCLKRSTGFPGGGNSVRSYALHTDSSSNATGPSATRKRRTGSKLRSCGRGLIAMANAGEDDNGSYFFCTLGSQLDLQNKHTMFGQVTRETVYDMLELEEALVGENDRPLYAPNMIKAELLNNPFSDIIPRKVVQESEEVKDSLKSKTDAVKNFNLLSFGEKAEEDEEESAILNKKSSGKSKSAHDHLTDPKSSS
ncbi:Peptidyl-prolyl cis-trans isomerase CWC27 like protein [Eufriesea mexicana]|nr:Peptidyl-prolyl cis-trans isomerase CWC27 like protein [Eufriesea mexicana]